MHLYHGVRHQRDLYDAAFFRQLAIDNPSAFSYTPCVSDEASEYSTGLVTDVVAQNYPSCKGFHAYLCGPPAMITTAVQMLRRKRVAPRFVYREEFTPPPGGSR
jgi:phenol hydroxylase P5 protein